MNDTDGVGIEGPVIAMGNKRYDPDDPDTPYETTFAKSALGYGGINMAADGTSHPVPEHEAIAGAIPQWVHIAEHEADALDLCLEFASHGHPSVRAESDVRTAARQSVIALEQMLGWRFGGTGE